MSPNADTESSRYGRITGSGERITNLSIATFQKFPEICSSCRDGLPEIASRMTIRC